MKISVSNSISYLAEVSLIFFIYDGFFISRVTSLFTLKSGDNATLQILLLHRIFELREKC